MKQINKPFLMNDFVLPLDEKFMGFVPQNILDYLFNVW